MRSPASNYVTTSLASIQWLGFMFANTVVIPLSVGAAFHLTHGAISGMLARSFMFTGLACLLQAWIGHKLPIMEGQSGLWWGIVLNLANLGAASGLSLAEIGGSLEVGMILGGLLIILLGVLGAYRYLNQLFRPIVMAVLLILLSAQLIDVFFRGMLGLDSGPVIQPDILLFSMILMFFVAGMSLFARGFVANISILFGLVVGWLAYVILFGENKESIAPSFGHIGQWFALGNPHFQISLVIAGVVTALLNTTNTIATLRASEGLFGREATKQQMRRSFILTGLYTMLSGPLALIPYAPYTSAIGFLRATRVLDRKPFIIAALLFMIIGVFPALAGFLSTLPIAVGDAVLFVAYLQIFGAALINVQGFTFNAMNTFRLAFPTLLGLAIMTLPSHSFSSLPMMLQVLLSNGMLLGILIAVVTENCIPWKTEKQG
ncbi:uracil/xanthine transporter [Alicyclobacillus tolerans]|uniref:Xanthine/uracil permease n=2 Tax=Alicyclobacillus tolerans TaxID=90970 RepID=A0A1M6W9R4_9BACL|nr:MULTISPECIES: uracil/xanthine transporter [Alicyclobacillus]MDP9729071.1 xanthine/uracil permease [Alicyclobacillus tengchongensis]SHK90504.1 Xanthine/uracil permease [Alicyclobacillus montanus]